ncbi:MAG TPA: ComEC family protein [Scandinavium sp.]|jgi:competence protein ComEC
MRLPTIAFSAIIGISPLLWLPELPSVLATGVITILAIALCIRESRFRVVGLTMLFFCWGILAAQKMVLPANTLSGKRIQADVVITATDGETTYYGKMLRINGERQFPAPGIVLYGQALPESVCAGQVWQMTIRSRAVHGLLNDGMFDSQRHALSLHRPLTGRFIQASVLKSDCSLRAAAVSSLTTALAPYPWQQVMLALAVGERTTVPGEIKLLLQQTGTSHLMAISGLHISLVAMMGWAIMRGLQRGLPCRRIGWRTPLLISIIAASIYAWLSGLQPPALRTLIAMIVWLLLRASGRCWSPWEVWLCCIAAILVMDPLAILAQSLWLSAFAVATLIFWYQWMPYRRVHCSVFLNAIGSLLHLQLGLMLLLLPLQVIVFHGASWTSLPANLIAVPWVTLGEIPLLLTGMVLHFVGAVSAEKCVWFLADRLLEGLFWFLRILPQGWQDIDYRWQGIIIAPWLMIIFWRFSGWRKWPASVAACGAILTLPLWRPQPAESWSMTMLDVGQGLSIVISRHGKALLYDTGLAWPGGDTAQQLIVPWLRWHHLQPEGIILSHEHLDHRGGLDTLLKTWPSLWVRSPLGWESHQPCFRGEHWRWQGLTFRAVWPLPGTTEKGNNRSCVVRVDDGRHSVLLTGDIEIPAEMSMLNHYWQHLASTLVQVPHHGSSTSSSPTLLQRVGGHAALASTARYNAWHFPSDKVKARYLQRQYLWFDTPHQGQITVNFSAEGWQIQSLRDQILPRWYHQWFGDARDNG